jgi:hypothetical protein
MSINFATEKEAKDFLKTILGDVDVKETIEQWKLNGVILDTIVEKAEDEFDKYTTTPRNLSKYKKILEYLREDNTLIELLYNAIQYQKEEMENIEQKKI